ncbi:HAD family phosphatase [Caldisphaera sp.]|uniref:HAD family hydrolase n=1 Tax=Caldisphaera sp. TaxID=2060322 RepID=UPI0025BB4E17|nr:HAD-IA family hydrolase [Caldisphaera sp.]
MKIKGIISDLDGTLADTKNLHFEAWKKTAEKFGVKVNLKINNLEKFWGLKDLDFLIKYTKELNIKLDSNMIKHILSLKSQEYQQLARSIKPDKCLENFLSLISKYKLKFAIVTSSMKSDARAILEALNIKYDLLISSDDVKNVKPDPEPIILAIEKLGLKKEEIIGLGDSIYDIIAYKKAGLDKIFLINQDYADAIKIHSLCDISNMLFKELIS